LSQEELAKLERRERRHSAPAPLPSLVGADAAIVDLIGETPPPKRPRGRPSNPDKKERAKERPKERPKDRPKERPKDPELSDAIANGYKPEEARTWIFQCNPSFYDIRSSLKKLKVINFILLRLSFVTPFSLGNDMVCEAIQGADQGW